MSANATARTTEGAGRFDKKAAIGLSVAGADCLIHPCGVLYWPSEETLVVADLHLEKGSHYATKQIFLPPYDTSATLQALAEAIATFQPSRVIALGDSFHDADGPARLNGGDADLLRHMVDQTDWVWIAGNHDPELPASLGGSFVASLAMGGLNFCHEPEAGHQTGEVAGHLHPCARIRGRGRTVRKRCFLTDGNRLILPAFGAFTGGLNVRDEAFYPLFPAGQYHAYMMGTEKLYPVASNACLPG